jgi:hypothetical protein
MSEIMTHIHPVGNVEQIIEYRDGSREVIWFKNTVLQKGREALAACLANKVGIQFDYFINRMDFGDNGTVAGVPKIIGSDRDGLFGIVRVSKPVIASIPVGSSSQVIFTAVVGFDDGNGYPINEMALRMANGHYYSMATFADLNKTSNFQITWNWSCCFI